MTFKEKLETFFNKSTNIAVDFMITEDYGHEGPWESCRCIDNYGGEGCGDNYWSVYSFTKGSEEILIKFRGWYQSFHGAEYQDFWFVTPKKKEITVYE